MKKIICLILIGMVCLGLSGCLQKPLAYTLGYLWEVGGSVPKYEQRQMLKHLEKKYGEEFVIKEIHTPQNVATSDRGATVYPKGREDEAFYVYLGTRGNKKIIDDYVFHQPQKKMTPIYEEWIQGVFPTAKLGVRLDFNIDAEEAFYNPDKSLQQFVDASSGDIICEVSILLSEELLTNKEEIFEKLSNLPETEPLSGFHDTEYRIGFMKKNAFDNVKSVENISIPYGLKYYKPGDEDYVAVTEFYSKNSENEPYAKEEIIEWLNSNYERQEDLSELEERMLPVYEKWIQSAVPLAKVAINLTLLVGDSETFYHPDKSFQQFADEAKEVQCDVNIILSEELLPKKDEIFEKLSTLLGKPPISFYDGTYFEIGFLTKDSFDDIKSGEYIDLPDTTELDEPEYQNFVAVVNLTVYNHAYSKEKITEELHDHFVQKEDTE